MNKTAKTELIVGLFLLLGLALIAGGIFLIGDFSSDKKNQYTLRIVYKDAGGLIKGSNISMGGAKVGEVDAYPQLTDSGNNVIVLTNINGSVKIPRGSTFKIEMQNLLGNKYIDIVPPEEENDDFYHPNELIFGDSGSAVSTIRENVVSVSIDLANLLRKLDQNSDGLVKTIDEVSSAAHELAEATKSINNNLLSENNLKNIEKILVHWEQGSREIPEIAGEVKTAVSEFKTSAKEVRSLIDGANDRLSKVDNALDIVEPTMKSFRKSSENIEKITTGLNKGQGTAGLFIKDEQFRKNVETFIRNLRDYGILRYRNPNEPEPLTDPRAGYSGSRR